MISDELNSKINTLRENFRKKYLDTAPKPDQQEVIDNKQRAIDALNSQLDALKLELEDEKRKHNAELQKQQQLRLNSTNANRAELEKLSNEIEMLQRMTDQRQREINQYKTLIKRAFKHLVIRTNEAGETLRDESGNAMFESKDAAELRDLKQQVGNTDNLEDLKRQIKNQAETIDAFQTQAQEDAQKISDLSSKLATAQNTNDRYARELNSCLEISKHVANKVLELNKEVDDLQNQLSNKTQDKDLELTNQALGVALRNAAVTEQEAERMAREILSYQVTIAGYENELQEVYAVIEDCIQLMTPCQNNNVSADLIVSYIS